MASLTLTLARPVIDGALAAAAQQKFIAQTGTVLGAAGACGSTGDEQRVIAAVAAAGLRHA
jgi:hypothetical protein